MSRIGFILNTNPPIVLEGRVIGSLGDGSDDLYFVDGKQVTRAEMQREYSKAFERELEKMFRCGLTNT